MFTEDLNNVLSRVGLKQNEAKIYLACLKNPTGLHVKELVDQTSITWSSTKLILERLIAKGFVTSHLRESRKVYTAESPQSILFKLQETTDDFRSIIPLLSISQFGGKSSKVRFFEGKDVVKNVLKDILLTLSLEKGTRKEYLAISCATDIDNIDKEAQAQFVRRRVKEGIPIRWIAPQRDKNLEYYRRQKEELREMKLIDDKKYPFHMEISIYADSVALWSLESEKPSAVIIENERLASSFRSIFNFFWDSIQ